MRRTYLGLGVAATTIAGIFIASVLAAPFLTPPAFRPLRTLPRASDIKPQPRPVMPTAREVKAKKEEAELQKAYQQVPRVPGKRATQLPIAPPPSNTPLPAPPGSGAKPLSIGFYIDWDESSYSSLERNLNQLDWVMPQWVHLTNAKPGENPIADDLTDPQASPSERDQALKALNLIRQRRPQISIIPMVQNLDDEKWQKEVLARAIADDSARQNLVSALSRYVEQNQFAGVCVDFEEVAPESQANLLKFMQQL